jgi:hypothetical protein
MLPIQATARIFQFVCSVLFVFCSTGLMAQNVNIYSFSSSTGATYTPLTAGTVLAAATGGNYTSGTYSESGPGTLLEYKIPAYTLPFTFYFDNRPYNAINIHSAGYLTFGNDTTSILYNPVAYSGSEMNFVKGIISPFGTGLTGMFITTPTLTGGSNVLTNVLNTSFCQIGAKVCGPGITPGTTITGFTSNTVTMSAPAVWSSNALPIGWPTGIIRVATTGTAPNRTFIIEYYRMADYYNGSSSYNQNTNISFQVHLKEGGGNPANQTIDYVYGENYRYASTSYTDPQVGLRGRNNTEFNIRKTNWVSSVQGTVNSNGLNWSQTDPPAGLKYTFTPPPSCTTPTGVPTALSFVQGASTVKGTFIHGAPQPHKYLVVRSIGALTGTPQDGSVYEPGNALGNGVVVSLSTSDVFMDAGLSSNTTYRYTIFSANDACTSPRYGSTALSGAVTTAIPASYQWTGSYNDNWTMPGSWIPLRNIPDPTDTLYFNGGQQYSLDAVPGETVAKIKVSNNTQLEVYGRYGFSDSLQITDSFIVDAGSSYKIGVPFAGETVLTFRNTGDVPIGLINGTLYTGYFYPENGITYVNGTLDVYHYKNVNTESPLNLKFNPGSFCVVELDESPYGAFYDPASTILVKASASVAKVSGRSVGNVTIDMPTSATSNMQVLTAGVDTIKGNLTIVSTGNGSTPAAYLKASTSTDTTIILGNLIQNGGVLRLSSRRDKIIVQGNISLNGGTLDLNFSSDSQDTTVLFSRGNFTKLAAHTMIESRAGTGMICFNGTTQQSLNFAGTVTDTIHYVLNNPAGAALTGSLSLYQGGSLTMTAGTLSGTGSVSWNTTNTNLIYNGSGPQTAGMEFPLSTPRSLTIKKGTSVLTVPFSRSVPNTLTMISGDIDLGSNILTLGTSATSIGALDWTSGSIRVSSGGLKRWYSASGTPTTPSSNVGFYPLATGAEKRHLNIYFSTSAACSTGGTITVNHNFVQGLTTGLSVADGSYTIGKRNNSFWTFTIANNFLLNGLSTISLKAQSGGYDFYSSNPANLRLMRSGSVTGTHIAGTGAAPDYVVGRSGITQINLVSDSWYIGGSNADLETYYIAGSNGNWNDGTIWNFGTPPGVNNAAIIDPGVTVGMNGVGLAKALFLQPGSLLNISSDSLYVGEAIKNDGTININGGKLTLGPVNGGNKNLTSYGGLNMSSGALNVNGSMMVEAGSSFSQSGGNINIDGNAANVASGSSTGALFMLRSVNAVFSGGNITFADPPVAGYAFYYDYPTTGPGNNLIQCAPAHTFRFGNGISTDTGAKEYFIYQTSYSTLFRFGKIMVNNLGPSRKVVLVSPDLNAYDVSVEGMSELVMSSYSYNTFKGNIIVNQPAIFTCAGSLNLGVDEGNGLLPPVDPLIVGGTGTYRNKQSNPTGNFYSIAINNNKGVSFNIGDVSYTGELSFHTGKLYMGNSALVAGVGASISTGSTYQPSKQNGWIVGAYKVNTTAGSVNASFPVGDTSVYAPVLISGAAGSVTSGGTIAVATLGMDHPSIGSSMLSASKSINRYYFIEGSNGIAFAPGTVTVKPYWQQADRDAGVVSASLLAGQFAGGVWTYPTVQGATDTSIQIINSGTTLSGKFQIAEQLPSCTGQPVAGSVTGSLTQVCAGTNFDLNITGNSSGASDFSFKWQSKNSSGSTWSTIAGATNAQLTTSQLQSKDYRAIVKCNGSGLSDTTAIYTVTMSVPPSVVTPPAAATACVGSTVQFSVNAGGNPAPSIQWQVTTDNGINWSNLPGQNAAVLSFISSQSQNNSRYRAVLTNNCDGATSGSATLTITPSPTISIASTTTLPVCAGSPVSFTSSVANAGGSPAYQWRKNGTNIPGATSATYTAPAPNNLDAFSCELTSTACGAPATFNSNAVTVQTNAAPVATITPNSPQNPCTGQTVTFQANTGAGLNYQWLEGGVAIPGATGSSYATGTAGNYSVQVTNALSCATVSGSVAVTLAACGPVVTSLTPADLCQGGNVDISFQAPGSYNAGNVFTAQLSNASGSFASPVVVGTLSSTAGGTITGTLATNQTVGTGYRIRIISSNPVLTGDNNGSNLAVFAKPSSAQASISNTGLAICQGASTLLSVPLTAGFTYQWYLNSSAIPGATANSYTATLAGAYYADVFNASGCIRASASKTVTVTTVPALINPGSSQSICSGQSVTFSANTGSGLTYQWLNGGNLIAGATSATYITGNAGSYAVEVTNATGCANTSATVAVSVSNCGPSVTALSTMTLCQGGTVNVSFNAGGVFNANNIFTAQLSNASGSFASPVNIGTLPGTGSGIINGTLSGSQGAGSGYRIRVISSNPASTGADNGANLTVVAKPTSAQATITNTGSLTFCQGGSTLLSVPANAGFAYQWYHNSSPVPGATNNTYPAAVAGTYYAEVYNTTGCLRASNNKTVNVTSGPAATITPATTQTICPGQTITFQANTGSGLTYKWYRNNTVIGGATTSSYIAAVAGDYTVETGNTGSCTTMSAAVSVVSGSCGATVDGTGVISVCQGATASFNFSGNGFTAGNVFTLQLSDMSGSFATALDIGTLAATAAGTITGAIPASVPVGTGYKLRILSSNPVSTGPVSALTLTINGLSGDTVDLCAVTVDGATSKNLLVWNKPAPGAIDSFVIYRNTSATGVYQRIGAQPYTAFSTYLDNNSDPMVQAQRYYITAKSECGESDPGQKHRTMHLTINRGQDASTFNLIWNGYEGFDHGTYQIWRGSSAAVMSVLTEIEANASNSYTDFNAPAGTLYYMVSVADGPSCNPTARTTGGYQVTSNVASYTIDLPEADWLDVQLFPNPSREEGDLVVRSSLRVEDYEVKLTDITGRTVESIKVKRQVAARFGKTLAPGLYTVEVTGGGQRAVRKWMKL